MTRPPDPGVLAGGKEIPVAGRPKAGPDRVPYKWVPYLSNQASPSPQRQRIKDRGEDQTRY